jgi:hypothetical protein
MDGRIWGTEDGTFSEWTIHIDVKLREYISPMFIPGRNLKSVGTITAFASEGSVLHNSYRSHSPYGSSDGEGSATITGTLSVNATPAAIYRKTTADPEMMVGYGFDVPLGKALYFVGIGTDDQTFEVTERSGGTTSVWSSSFITVIGGRAPLLELREFDDLEYRYLEGGAMIGSFNHPTNDGKQISVSWSICPEGIACPQAPPLPDGGPSSESEPPSPDKPDCTELSQLTSAMRQLKETYDGFEDDYKKAVVDRDAARDHIWGFDGALRKYFTSMLALAGKGVSGALGKLIGYSKTLMGMSGEGNLDDVTKAAKALGPDVLKTAAAKEAVRAAVERAETYLAQTGDHQGALRLYSQSIGSSEELAAAGQRITKGLGLATSIVDYAEKTNSLFDLIQEWLDHNEAANRAQTQMDDINRRMDELQNRIDACRHAGGAMRRDVHLAAFYAAAATGSGDPASIQARLAATRARVEAVPSQLEAAAPWLLPFFADAPMSPRFAAALLGEAVPQLEAVRKTIDDAVAERQSMEKDLQQTIPQKPAAAKSGSATAALR